LRQVGSSVPYKQVVQMSKCNTPIIEVNKEPYNTTISKNLRKKLCSFVLEITKFYALL